LAEPIGDGKADDYDANDDGLEEYAYAEDGHEVEQRGQDERADHRPQDRAPTAEQACPWSSPVLAHILLFNTRFGTDAIIQANPDVQAFYAANDGMALGIQQAVINNELLGEVLVYGTDGNVDALASIEAGQLAGTASQYPYAIGAMGVESCVANAMGATVPEFIESPIALITADNLEDALAAAPAPFFECDNPVAALIEE
jgi:hypothetical protein